MLQKRFIELQGAYNVRDLGGYEAADGRVVNPGQIYRSDDLAALTACDIQIMEKLQLQTIIDFRAEDEIKKAPDVQLCSVKKYYPLYLNPGNILSWKEFERGTPGTMELLNRRLITHSLKEYGTFFKIISEEKNRPLIFHCSAGKDRTGIAAALFLAALGVSKEDIYYDYLLSKAPVKKKYYDFIHKKPSLAPLFTVNESYIKAAFDEIDSGYGGISGYFDELDVDIIHLRQLYTS